MTRSYFTPFFIGLLCGCLACEPQVALAAVATPVGGTMAAQNASAVAIAGGTVSGLTSLGVSGTSTLAGHLLFTDNTYDIGASGATRPRNIYAAGTITAGDLDINSRFFTGPFGGTNNTFTLLFDTNDIVRLSSQRSMVFKAGAGYNQVFASDVKYFQNQAESVNFWIINSSGHFLGGTDNTYDIGASGATRPRNGYFGTSVVAPTVSVNVIQGGTVKALTDSTPTGFVRIFCANDVAIAGVIHYGIYAKDGSDDIQMRSGSVNFAIANKAGAGGTTCGHGTVINEAVTTSAGTLTVSFDSDVTAGSTVDIRANAVSSLTETSLDIRYRVEIFGASVTVTPL